MPAHHLRNRAENGARTGDFHRYRRLPEPWRAGVVLRAGAPQPPIEHVRVVRVVRVGVPAGKQAAEEPSHSRATAWRARMGARAGTTRGAAPRHKVGCAARRGLRELVRIPRPIDELRVDETIGTPHDFAKAVRYSQANGGEYFCKRYVRNLVSFGAVVACGCKILRTSRADSCDHACLFWHKSYARGCVRSIPQ